VELGAVATAVERSEPPALYRLGLSPAAYLTVPPAGRWTAENAAAVADAERKRLKLGDEYKVVPGLGREP
jgi:multidrug efflux pump subunit AcrB